MIKVPSYITNWDMPPGTLEQTYPILAIDAETVSLENKLVLGIGISWDGVHGVYFLNPRDPRLIALINRTDQVVVQNGSFDIPEPVTYDVGIEKLGNMIGCIRGVSLQKGHQIARHLIEWKGIKFTEKGDK